MTARRTAYKRASFREGIRWIAFNDEPTITDVDEISALVTVALLADLFGKDAGHVAVHVARERAKEARNELGAAKAQEIA